MPLTRLERVECSASSFRRVEERSVSVIEKKAEVDQNRARVLELRRMHELHRAEVYLSVMYTEMRARASISVY